MRKMLIPHFSKFVVTKGFIMWMYVLAVKYARFLVCKGARTFTAYENNSWISDYRVVMK